MVTEEIAGTWLCPKCSPSTTFYLKQLMKNRAAPTLAPKLKKPDESAGSKGKEQEPTTKNEPTAKRGIAVKRPITDAPTSSEEKEHKPAAKKTEMVKKGVAVKKPVAEKAKPKWIGWVEMSSDAEEEYKKKVDESFRVEERIQGRRTRASKAAAVENETGSRMLRTRSRPAARKIVVETDSEEEEEEPSLHEAESSTEESSDDYEDPEDTMDMDEGADSIQEHSAEDLSDSGVSPAPEQTTPSSGQYDEESDSEVVAEDFEDSTYGRDTSSEHDVENSMEVDPNERESEPCNNSTDQDDNDAWAPAQTPAKTSNPVDLTAASSPSPESTPATKPASPGLSSEDSMDVDEGHEVQDQQDRVFATVIPAVESHNYAALYQHQGNYWGDFPESAVRSTLPRLG